jgi:hypothetical protein
VTLDPATRDAVRAGARSSARQLTPWFVPGQRGVGPARINDVGCGEGWFARELQIMCPQSDVTALDFDGDGGPNPHTGVRIAHWNAEAHDVLPACDMAVCLEVAEHLTPASGEWLVGELCRTTTKGVWFSAAIPHQGGDGHLNEQWPTYWHDRFASHGWLLDDPIREFIWRDDLIEPWYKQNVLYARRATAAEANDAQAPLHLVHPAFYESRVAERDRGRGWL